MKKLRHNWINYPNRSNKKCTKCGIMKRTNQLNKYGCMYYDTNGIELKENPGCKI